MSLLLLRQPRGLALARLRLPAYAPMRRLGGHGDHHAPPPPSFARLPPPTQSLEVENDLIWNDGVAPELALDFDAPEIDKWTGLAMWLGGLGFFAAVGLFVKVVLDPPSRKPSVKRVLDVDEALGGYAPKPQPK